LTCCFPEIGLLVLLLIYDDVDLWSLPDVTIRMRAASSQLDSCCFFELHQTNSLEAVVVFLQKSA
jgi:hypothetical protein